MFTKSIDATPGLTDFQIEYVRTHMNVPTTKAEKKGNVWGISILAAMIATTCGLWVCVVYPAEAVPNVVVNMTVFGVVVMILVHIIALFALVVAMTCVGVLAGLKAAAKEIAPTSEEGRELALRTEAKRMMLNRDSLVIYRPSWQNQVRVFFGRTASLAFFVGMIAYGYVFAPLIMAFVVISSQCISRLMRHRVIVFVKRLTAKLVAELEAAHQRAEAEDDTPEEVIDVPSLTAPGPFKFRFEATDGAGDDVRETVEADNEDDAQQKIRQMGYFVTKIRRCRA